MSRDFCPYNSFQVLRSFPKEIWLQSSTIAKFKYWIANYFFTWLFLYSQWEASQIYRQCPPSHCRVCVVNHYADTVTACKVNVCGPILELFIATSRSNTWVIATSRFNSYNRLENETQLNFVLKRKKKIVQQIMRVLFLNTWLNFPAWGCIQKIEHLGYCTYTVTQRNIVAIQHFLEIWQHLCQ